MVYVLKTTVAPSISEIDGGPGVSLSYQSLRTVPTSPKTWGNLNYFGEFR